MEKLDVSCFEYGNLTPLWTLNLYFGTRVLLYCLYIWERFPDFDGDDVDVIFLFCATLFPRVHFARIDCLRFTFVSENAFLILV